MKASKLVRNLATGMEGKTLKNCSTYKDAEAEHGGVNNPTNPLQKAKRELETKSDPSKKKKPKQETCEVNKEPKSKLTSEEKEMRELSKSFKKMTCSVKILHESLLEGKETPKKEKEEEHDCCLESYVSEGRNCGSTILVKGFDDSLPRGDIKSALWEHFSSCGVVKRVFVPFACKTGASVAFAFIDLQTNSDKALTLHGSLLKGWTLEVMLAKTTPEYSGWRGRFKGCQRCVSVLLEENNRFGGLARTMRELETNSDPKKTCEVNKEDSLELTSEEKEMRKLRKSFKKMTDAVKILQESLLIEADMPVIVFEEKETPKKQKEEEHDHDCCLESEVSEGRNNKNTIWVKGFDDSLPRGDIKSALWEHFSSCGVVKRVFVPFDCKTGASVGFAFIDLQNDSQKALTLHGSLLKGWTLEVTMALTTRGYTSWRGRFKGCKRCGRVLLDEQKRFGLESREYWQWRK